MSPNRDSAGIGNFRVVAGGAVMRADPEQAVFRLKNDMHIVRNVIGDFRRQADAQSDDVAFGKFLCHPAGDDFAALFFGKRVNPR